MNIFEGSRRVALLLVSLIVIFSIAAIYNETPHIVIGYRIPILGYEPVRMADAYDCRIGIDGIERRQFETSSGKPYEIAFCFKAIKSNGGALLVPFRESGELFMMNDPYSKDVQDYMKATVEGYLASKADDADASEKYSNARFHTWLTGIGYLALGLFCYWLAICVIGWIVRGFLGIPRGQDYRIAPIEK